MKVKTRPSSCRVQEDKLVTLKSFIHHGDEQNRKTCIEVHIFTGGFEQYAASQIQNHTLKTNRTKYWADA